MDSSTIFWIAVIVLAFVYVDVMLVEIRRCAREAKRLVRRLEGYADLPIFSLAAVSSDDALRIATALERIPGLVLRAEAALVALKLRKPSAG
jgi:hypothetical protein